MSSVNAKNSQRLDRIVMCTTWQLFSMKELKESMKMKKGSTKNGYDILYVLFQYHQSGYPRKWIPCITLDLRPFFRVYEWPTDLLSTATSLRKQHQEGFGHRHSKARGLQKGFWWFQLPFVFISVPMLLGKSSNLTTTFCQKGWNHQLVEMLNFRTVQAILVRGPQKLHRLNQESLPKNGGLIFIYIELWYQEAVEEEQPPRRNIKYKDT